MYSRETRVLLRHYLEQGVGKAELARRFGVSRRTVYHWIETEQLCAWPRLISCPGGGDRKEAELTLNGTKGGGSGKTGFRKTGILFLNLAAE